MAYTRCTTGPAIGPAGRGHMHDVSCVGSGPLQRGVPYHTHQVGMGWVPANGPKSGPPGPLVTGYVYGIGQDEGPVRRGLKNPLVWGVLAAVAYVLWKK